MWTFDNPARDRRRRLRLLAAAAAAALAAPIVATSGIVGAEPDRNAPRKAAAAGYVLRCWQEGRLILEEHHVRLPVDTGATRLQLIDRNDQTIFIAETKNATCLVKPRPPERPRSELP
jgi:hypothetical protein